MRKATTVLRRSTKNIPKKVQDGDIDIALRRENNVDGMAQAAGVEDYKNVPSRSC